MEINFLGEQAVSSVHLGQGARNTKRKIGESSRTVFQQNVSLQVGEHGLRIVIVLFSLMTIIFTAGALAEVVYPLLRIGFCKAPGIYPEIPLQLDFLKKWPLSWREGDFSVEADDPSHGRSLRPGEEQQNVLDSPILCRQV